MRTKIIAGNWKMNTTLADALVLAGGVRNGAEHIDRIEIVLCPPLIWLTEIAHEIVPPKGLPHLKLGGQNMYFEPHGAFTGETAPGMVAEVAEYVIIGHSERTHIFRESAELVNQKLLAAFAVGLTPILCVGEDEKSADSKDSVAAHLHKLLHGLDEGQKNRLVVAYEPVWAIGSGNPATPEYAQEVMAALRAEVTPHTRIIYGGSVNEENARGFLELPDCDGLLPGGTSLKLKAFLTVCQIADDLAGHQPKSNA